MKDQPALNTEEKTNMNIISGAGTESRSAPADRDADRQIDKTHGKKAIEAASFVVVGFGMSQAIRLAGNIVLTRLLVPEIFGIITIARVFYIGLGLFSDVGLEPAIIRSPRANDTTFLNTAWTIQIIRSVFLAVMSAIIAYPVSLAYGEPVLVFIIPVLGLLSIPDGCRSTSLTMLGKELQQKKLTFIELTIQIVSLAVIITSALFMRNIWALLLGDLCSAVIRTLWSHAINKVRPNRLMLEKAAVRELLGFGKWIMLSTAMMFLATQADRFMLGKLFTMTWFGVYSIAVTLAELPKQIINRLNQKVIFPLVTKYSELSRNELREKMRKPRWVLLLGLAGLLAFFGSFGDLAILLLYDARYEAAAWILPMLAFGIWPLMMLSTVEGSLLAIGRPTYSAMGNLAKFLYMVIAVPLAHKTLGEFGVILVIALNDLPSYVIINIGLARERLSLIKQDLLLTLALVALTALLIGFRLIVGWGIPGMSPLFRG